MGVSVPVNDAAARRTTETEASMEPILVDVPESIETERLLIRAPRAGDGSAVNAAKRETWPALQQWMAWAAGEPSSVEEDEAFARRARAQFIERSDLLYFFLLKDSQEFVASSGLHRIDWTVPKFEIGYWVRSRFEGQGYVSEGVRRLTQLAFDTLGAQRVEIRCDERNTRSRNVAERLGFQREGALRCDARANDGTLRTTLVYGMVAADWSTARDGR